MISASESKGGRPGEVQRADLLAPEQRDAAGGRQIGAEGQGGVPAASLQDNQQQAQHRAQQRGEQDDQGQGLPAQPGAQGGQQLEIALAHALLAGDRKSTRLNSSHVKISYAVFCLKKKT